LAVQALAGRRPVTQLAAAHQVRRKFIYQQADLAKQALSAAFAPDLPDADAVLFSLPVTGAWLRRLIVALILLCHRWYHGVYELLRDVVHCPRSLGYIHGVAHTARARAGAANEQHDLARGHIGAPDAIFQARPPVLVGGDVAATYCYRLSQEEHGDGETWGLRLLQLQGQGFAPRAIIGDGGSGLQAGQEWALPDVPRRGDVFHVVHAVTPLVSALENRAYQALTACVKLERQQAAREGQQGRRLGSVSQKLQHARPAAAAAVAVADDVATLVRWLHQDILAVAGPCHAERVALYDFVVADLRARAPQGPHRLNPVCT
jgi:hypothetical protein